MSNRYFGDLINTTWKLVVERGHPRQEVARTLGISEGRVDRIINAMVGRRRKLTTQNSEPEKWPHVVLLMRDVSAVESTAEARNRGGVRAEVIHAVSREQLQEALRCFHIDIVISNNSVVDRSATHARELARGNDPEVVFVVVSGRIDASRVTRSVGPASQCADDSEEPTASIVPDVLRILSAARAKPWRI